MLKSALDWRRNKVLKNICFRCRPAVKKKIKTSQVKNMRLQSSQQYATRGKFLRGPWINNVPRSVNIQVCGLNIWGEYFLKASTITLDCLRYCVLDVKLLTWSKWKSEFSIQSKGNYECSVVKFINKNFVQTLYSSWAAHHRIELDILV